MCHLTNDSSNVIDDCNTFLGDDYVTIGSKASHIASLPHRFFLVTSFSSGWLGKQATFNISKIPIKNRSEW